MRQARTLQFLTSLVLTAGLILPLSSPQASDGHAPDGQINGMPGFAADYELQRNNTRAARLTRSLSCSEGICEFRSAGNTVGVIDLVLRGSIDEWTRFRYTEDGIEPLEYSYRQKARGGNNEFRRLFFNSTTGKVSSRGDDQWEQDMDGETMDQLLSQLRLMQAVRAGQTEMAFSVVDEDGEVDEYRFKVTGMETIRTNAGTFDAVHVERVGGSKKRRTDMWFAPELDHMPIRIRHERVGRESYTATLTEIREAP